MADRPKRIQLSRAKGWRLPTGAVNVARPGRFGNPFPIGKMGLMGRIALDDIGAVGLFSAMLLDTEMRAEAGYPDNKTIVRELRGKDLACWCKLGMKCHADELLDLANTPDTVEQRNIDAEAPHA